MVVVAGAGDAVVRARKYGAGAISALERHAGCWTNCPAD
jgi:hypothetical protein